MSIITKLEAENVKRIRCIKIEPTGAVVVIGGMNDQGKSSALDSIEMALAGKSSIPSMPIRKGQAKARILLETDELIVKRTFTEGGTNVIVTSKAGLVFPSPQAMLDKLYSALTFDPLDFSRMDDKERSDTLRILVGLDFTAIENEREVAYNERTLVNRDVKSLAQRIEAMPEPPEDTPNEPISMADLTEKYRKATESNQQIKTATQMLVALEKEDEGISSAIVDAECHIEKLNKAIQENVKKREEIKVRHSKGAVWIEEHKPINLGPLQEAMGKVELNNTFVRQKQELDKLRTEYATKSSEHSALTAKIDTVDSRKQELLASAKFPIKGLSFNEAGNVTFEGIPWDQLSSSKQLKISVAMGFAMNPKLKVLLIRDGSLLDEGNLKLISEMAEKQEGQVWIERVSTGSEVSVVIEDGMIKKEDE
jgi:hypothetical protein